MFKIANMRSMAERPTELYEITANEEVKLGEALVLNEGKLTKCAATATPEFIAMGAGNGTTIPVVRLTEEDVLAAPLSVEGASLKVGDKVTLDATGLKVTATTASGVFMITKIHDTKANGIVEGMFRR